MDVTKNYTGRSVDLLIFQNTAPRGEKKLSLGWGGNTGGALTTGVQKLAQLWTILFLTEQGSIPTSLDDGTVFLFALRTGAIQDESDVQTAFAEAAKDVLNQLQAREIASDLPIPLDEQIRSASLLSFTLDPATSTLSLRVSITSMAGTKHDIILPVSVPIQ
jgi:hypothetical protein